MSFAPVCECAADFTPCFPPDRTIVKLGYHITLDKPPNRIRSIRLPNDPFMQSNGYKPAPLDLSQVSLTGQIRILILETESRSD